MKRQAKAFTLLEVLLVIVIIGMLATVLIFTIGGTQEQAKIDTTRLTIKKIENKLEEYNLRMGHFPNEAEGNLKALADWVHRVQNSLWSLTLFNRISTSAILSLSLEMILKSLKFPSCS